MACQGKHLGVPVMSSGEVVEYPEIILPRLRYKFCPMCRTALSTEIINDDHIARVACPSCGWVHYPTNAMGVNVVVIAGEYHMSPRQIYTKRM